MLTLHIQSLEYNDAKLTINQITADLMGYATYWQMITTAYYNTFKQLLGQKIMKKDFIMILVLNIYTMPPVHITNNSVHKGFKLFMTCPPFHILLQKHVIASGSLPFAPFLKNMVYTEV